MITSIDVCCEVKKVEKPWNRVINLGTPGCSEDVG